MKPISEKLVGVFNVKHFLTHHANFSFQNHNFSLLIKMS